MTKFTMPAEWAPHEGTWLAWPHHKADWPGKFEPIPWVFVEMIRLISASEKVFLIVSDEKQRDKASEMLRLSHVDERNIEFVLHRSNRGWLRDCGPIFVRDESGDRHALHFKFNAWAKYRNYQRDALIGELAARHADAPITTPKHRRKRVVLEGGGIEVNGAGILLTTEECLLSDVQCRNPGFTRDDYESVFAEYLGIEQTIWLGHGVVGDDTHGHVDDLARFVNETTIVTVREADASDANYNALEDNWQRLQQARSKGGKPFDVVSLPMLAPLWFEGYRLPASYANFYITNGAVIVPIFNDANDRRALSILAEHFPGREVIGLYARDLILGLGAIHCLTQQQPVL